ncbi:unnamed protein product [Bemisia tabaci]|uniref:Uncharacterized protein n=1 Tax=Bemisia tabaci TaxID=7038 RepID=A0A9P0CCC0_BEMTA|nr:unnamed protein product [Bemisia tabaci]
MESWMVDIKRVKIPRPKFQTGGCRYPTEPPKDYYSGSEDMESVKNKQSLAKATEELRRAVQEKL